MTVNSAAPVSNLTVGVIHFHHIPIDRPRLVNIHTRPYLVDSTRQSYLRVSTCNWQFGFRLRKWCDWIWSNFSHGIVSSQPVTACREERGVGSDLHRFHFNQGFLLHDICSLRCLLERHHLSTWAGRRHTCAARGEATFWSFVWFFQWICYVFLIRTWQILLSLWTVIFLGYKWSSTWSGDFSWSCHNCCILSRHISV